MTIGIHVSATPAATYTALTDPAALTRWLAEHVDVSIEDGRFEFWGRYTPQGERGRQRLLAAERDRLLRIAWTLDGEETTTEVRLEPADGGTRLVLDQTGVPSMEELMAPTGPRDGLHTLHTFWGFSLANLAEYVEGRQSLPLCDFSEHRPNEIRIDLDLAASPERVFAALVEPKLILAWFGVEPDVEAWVGGRHTLGVDGRIVEFEPGRALVYVDDEGAVTRWELTGSPGRTHLTFVQSGFADDELDNAAQHEAGWLAGLIEMRRMLELGDAWLPRSESPVSSVDTVYQARIPAPPSSVFRAFTDPAALTEWFAEYVDVSIADGRFGFWGRHTPDGASPGAQRLLAVEPDRLLRFEWTLEATPTTVEIRLEPDGPDATVVSFGQSGLPGWPDVLAGTGSPKGLHTFWPRVAGNLVDYVEGRAPLSRGDYRTDRDPQIRLEVTLDAAPEEVFSALIEPEQLNRWVGGDAAVEPHVGGRYSFAPFDDNDDNPWRILELEPNRSFAHTAGFGATHNVVHWELEGSEGKTRLTLVQSGFTDQQRPDAASQEAGWISALVELRRLVELGSAWRPIPHYPDLA